MHPGAGRPAAGRATPGAHPERALRTTLIPGLLARRRRNRGRGAHTLALCETGLVFLPAAERVAPPRLPVDRRPTDVHQGNRSRHGLTGRLNLDDGGLADLELVEVPR